MRSTKILIRTGLVLAAMFILLQFIHQAPNTNGEKSKDISSVYPLPQQVLMILKTSCYDCHSNYTVYPWYAAIQPLGFWIHHHIDEGKHELNFNEFASYKISRQYHVLQKTAHEIEESDMPLQTYTLIHRNSTLDEQQKKIIQQWTKALCDTIAAHVPADSITEWNHRHR